MTGALALVAALTISSQLQTHPTGLPSVGPSRANSLRTAPIMDKLYEQAGKPALDFDFARYKDLHDNASGATSLVTFSRSAAQSPGTYVGSDGLIHDAAVNLALYSEQFDQWTNSSTTDSANQTAAPDGKQTADTVTATGANGTISRGVTTTAIDYTFSIYIKRKTGTGSIDISADGSTWVTQTITGDWQRFSVTQTGVAGTSNPGVRIVTSGDEVYLWGAQLEEGTTPTAYIKTTSQALAAPRFDHDPVTGESLGLLVEEARTNLVTYSEDFSTGTFSTGGGTSVTDNVSVGPDGAMVADEIIALGANAGRRVPISIPSSAVHTVSFFVKSGTSDSLRFGIFSGGFVAGTGAIEYGDGSISGATLQTVTGVGSEWTRVSFTTSAAISGTVDVYFYPGPSSQSNGDSNIYFGLQLESGTFPTSYIPTVTSQTRYADVAAVQDEDFATTNLLAYSESFDVGWTLTGFDAFGAGSVANAIESPDGQTTADFVRPSTATGFKGVEQSTSFPATATKTVYVKDSGVRYVQMNFSSVRSLNYANYDLQNVEVTQTGGSGLVGASISDAGNGWRRLVITETGAVVTTTHAISPVPSGTSARGASFTGDGTSGIYLWGASLTATEYPVAYVTTRNLLTDSQDFERSTWGKLGTTVGNDAAQAPDGTFTADSLIEQTTTSAHYLNRTGLGATNAVASVYIKNIDHTYLEIDAGAKVGIQFDGNGVAFFNGDDRAPAPLSKSIESVGNGWHRVSIESASAPHLYVNLKNATGSGGFSYTGTGTGILVWGAQLEPGTTPSEYVRTVDTVGKRYGWYEPTEGTVFVKADAIADTTAGQYVFTFWGDATNRISWLKSRANLGTDVGSDIRFSGTQQASLTTSAGVWVAPNEFLQTLAFKYNSVSAAYSTGNLLGPDTTATIPIVVKLNVGNYDSSSNALLNGHIKRLTYWPRRQADSTLQVITQ